MPLMNYMIQTLEVLDDKGMTLLKEKRKAIHQKTLENKGGQTYTHSMIPV